jgi:hypothetical protein
MRADPFTECLDVDIAAVHRLDLSRVITGAEEPRVQQAALDALDIERVESLWPEWVPIGRLNDHAPPLPGIEGLPPFTPLHHDRRRVLMRDALGVSP